MSILRYLKKKDTSLIPANELTDLFGDMNRSLSFMGTENAEMKEAEIFASFCGKKRRNL
jgi:hypothetical protein